MAGVVPSTNQEAMMKLLQQIAVAQAAPDADLPELAKLQEQVLSSIRKPFDTASPGSPVGASMDMSAGAGAPQGAAPGQMSPMLQALMSQAQGQAPPTPTPQFPIGGGVQASTPPNMDEVRRMMAI